jgi:ECF transporter S component (folate family)
MTANAKHLRRIVVSAVLLSLALIAKSALSFYIPLFGQNSMRVSIAGIFSIMPSIMFGPVYGALVSGLSDLLGYLLAPTGAYLPLMTLVVAAGGFLRGLIWQLLRGKKNRNMRICVIAIASLLLIIGLYNAYSLSADGVNGTFYEANGTEAVNTDGMHLISRMLIERTVNAKDPAGSLNTYIITMTSGLIGSAGFGLILAAADIILSLRFKKHTGNMMRLLLAMVLSGLFVATLNTVVLRETVYESWKVLPFAVVWLPRIIEEILANIVKAYFIIVLLGIFDRQRNLRELVND